MFEKVNSYIPLGTIFIIVFGYIKLKIYYLLFDISIHNYLNTTDIVNLVLGDVIYMGFILFFPIISFIKESNKNNLDEQVRIDKIINSAKKLKDEINHLSMKYNLSDYKISPIKQQKKTTRILLIVFTSVLILLNIYYILNNRFDGAALGLYQSSCFIIAILVCTFISSKYLITRSYSLSVIILSSIFYLFVSSFCDYYKYKNDVKSQIIKLENSEIRTTANLKRIGSTDKYLFLRDEKEKKSIIISNDKILSIEEFGKPEVN